MNNDAKHPELQDGEVFLTNTYIDDFDRIQWKTKRMGEQAYDKNGKPVPGYSGIYPVFVQKSEYEKFPPIFGLLKLFLPLITVWIFVLTIEWFKPQAIGPSTKIGLIMIVFTILISILILFKQWLSTKKETKGKIA